MPSEAINIWCDEMIEGTITFENGQTIRIAYTEDCRYARSLAEMRAECYQRLRRCAAAGVYPGRLSRFSNKEQYLPLDLWDSTPDP